jgi:circadian clock protein KaiC
MSRPDPDGSGHRQTGVSGVDEILDGGLSPGSATLVRGPPGSGKTIVGLHFLATGVASGETGLYINLGEPSAYLRETARGFGLDIDPVAFLDLSPSREEFRSEGSYDLFSSAEVEGEPLVEEIRGAVREAEPVRVVVDPVTEFRYLTADEHQFRSRILGLLDFLKDEGATVVLTSQAADSMPDDDLQFLADAVINLEEGPDRRTVHVSKLRGASARRGRHTLRIIDEGMRAYPRLDPGRHENEDDGGVLSSGISELDTLLSGGLERGTITLFSGPTGVGKTTMGLQFAMAAADQGHRSVLYSFEENTRTLLGRAESIGIPAGAMIDRGSLVVEELGSAGLTLDEFTHRVRTEVEDNDTGVVMVDGTTGFEKSLTGLGDDPMEGLVRIGQYLRNTGTTGLVTNEVHQITGTFRATERMISHLADAIVVLRHVEYRGELRKVIGVLKKRTSDHEPRLRELEITADGLGVGEPLTGLRGILTGTPEWGDDAP